MKKLLLLALAACLPFSVAMAQSSANFHLYYGNVDGSAMSVGLDRDIAIPVWMATDATPGNPDSVTFVHMPLSSDDLIITGRSNGFFEGSAYPDDGPSHGTIDGLDRWDDRSFLALDHNQPVAGWTSQSILGFAYLTDPRDPQNFIYNLGVPQLVASFMVHTVNDPALIGTTTCVAFQEGFNAANGSTLWGMQDGVRGVNPTKQFPCMYFSPNADPVWTVFPTSATGDAGVEFCFDLAGTDGDPLNDLHIVYSGIGTYTEAVGGPGGVTSGTWCGTLAAGAGVLSFLLDDGTVQIPLDVPYTVTAIGLEIGCVNYFPGAVAQVPIYLHTAALLTGGFEILINTDPTALNLTSVTWEPRINNGHEYHQWIQDPIMAGSDRFVWIANINDGVTTPPAAPGHAAIMTLYYQVSSSLPFGMHIPIDFLYTDYTDNTISNETGYLFIHPLLTAGCVNTVNPDDFKGDPNMNCYTYEVADAVLVARRLIEGYIVWSEDDAMANVLPCDRHAAGNDPLQESAGDLNANSFVDIADLVRFINILNGYIMPKLDPLSGQAVFTMNNGSVNINSPVEVGGVLVRINHDGEIGTPVANNGMEIMSHDANGVLSVIVYSMNGTRIPAGNQTLFTINGQGTLAEVSAADSYGRLLDATASLETLPTQFAVNQNYPNPFNAKTLIRFDLPEAGNVTINVYSITGQLVETLGGQYEAGRQSVTWDASNVTSGVYFYKVSVGDHSQTMKMTLVK